MIRGITTVYDTPPRRDRNEDRLVLNQKKGIYGVCDGAGGLSEDVPGLPMSGAQIASSIVARECTDAEGSLYDAVVRANGLLEFEQKRFNVPDNKTQRWGTTAAVVRVTDTDLEWLVVGDSVILVVKSNGSIHLPGGHGYDHDGPAFAELVRLQKEGNTNKAEIDKILLPIHTATRNRANLDYGVINGEKDALGFIKSGHMSRKGITKIIMVTDGSFLPKEDPLAPDDWATWLDLYREGGLEHVLRTVRAMQADDPDCLKYPRLKGGDDAAAVALRFVD